MTEVTGETPIWSSNQPPNLITLPLKNKRGYSVNPAWSVGLTENKVYKNTPPSHSISKSHKKGNADVKRVQLVQWNCHSLNRHKLSYALSHNPEMLFLQEVWKPESELQDFFPQKSFLKLRENNRAGGSLLWLKGSDYKINRKLSINQDFDIHKILVDRDKFRWVGSVLLVSREPCSN